MDASPNGTPTISELLPKEYERAYSQGAARTKNILMTCFFTDRTMTTTSSATRAKCSKSAGRGSDSQREKTGNRHDLSTLRWA